MGPTPAVRSPSRETRLLLVTLAVSAILLLVLARFRFPEDRQLPPAAAPAGQALERLAARATYDELATLVARVDRRIAPSVLVFSVAPSWDPAAGIADSTPPRFAVGLRIRDDMALVALSPGESVRTLDDPAAPEIEAIARDEMRGLAVVRVPRSPAPTLAIVDIRGQNAAPTYLVAIEAGRAGPAARPFFLGRTDPVVDPRWNQPLTALGGLQTAQPGAFLFTLNGEFAGLVVAADGLPALAPAAALLAAADELAAGRGRAAGDLGLDVQPLTPPLARATGSERGVVVASVDASGPAADLQPGDVIEAIADRPVASLHQADLLVRSLAPGSSVKLRVRRGTEVLEPLLTARARPAAEPPAATLGIAARVRRGAGLEVQAVEDGSAAARAGLRPGDIIVSVNRAAVPSSAALTRAWVDAAPGSALLVAFVRDSRGRVTALEKP
jgi:hypothetical protein